MYLAVWKELPEIPPNLLLQREEMVSPFEKKGD
jgi:hypothetical protein